MASSYPSPAWLDRPVLKNTSKLFTLEGLLVAIILALAILSRFAILGERVMSHDEVNHVVPSYELYQGRGYRHDPITHGPFQFHVVALSYFLFGDNDFTSRVPAALFSVGAVAFLMFAFRRYLGRSGALIAGFLFLISPFMMFYGRYTRNEGFIELVGVTTLYGILRYLEKGDRFSMFLVTAMTALHFCIKETAFIYTAQALIFLFFMFLLEARRAEHSSPARFNRFLLLMSLAMLLVIAALGVSLYKADLAAAQQATATAIEPVEPEAGGGINQPASPFDTQHLLLYGEAIIIVGALVAGALGLFSLARDIAWRSIKQLRSFTLLIIIVSLILPMLSPFPISMLGWDPLDYINMSSLLRTGAFIALFFILAALIGIWWNPILWLQHALLFYGIFTVLYTTFFTNGNGFLTGLVGSLGYWLSQQGVERGSQPRYYYALIQMPIYEYLAMLGTVLAVYFGIKYRRFVTLPGFAPAHAPRSSAVDDSTPAVPVTGDNPGPAMDDHAGTTVMDADTLSTEQAAPITTAQEQAIQAFYHVPQPLPVLGLFVYWSVTSLLAFSMAGERMPWLTVHITMGFLLAAAWGLGYLVDTTDWKAVTRRSGFLALLLFPVLYASLGGVSGTLLGANPPFQGNTLEQLQATNTFILSLVASAASLAGILYLLRGWSGRQVLRLAALTFFALLAILTARTAYRASFINYDSATEYLVYAHAAPGPKQALRQIEEISQRTTGAKSIQVAYGGDALYPYWWYLRDYPNNRWFRDEPTRDLREFPIVIAGDNIYDKVNAVLGDNFFSYEYMRLWWPNQDYFNLSFQRVFDDFSNPQKRAAIFQIWLNRDFSDYAALSETPAQYTPESWSPGAKMRVYIRKDIVGQIWEYGVGPVALPADTDPYLEKLIELSPAQVVGGTGNQPGQFQAPRGIKAAPDGTLYVADSRNHRIQHLNTDGTVINTWGSFADQTTGNAPGGTFNEPWDVAVGPDGSVYVSDTWNHRVQKFTASGQFITMWGYFGQAEAPEAFWGPRGLAVDADGRVYVVDTGNKRVVIFDADGNFITQFGTAGFGEGQFDEPVGIALDASGNAYITDTWNQRVQVMQPSADGQFFTPLRTWDVDAWNGQSVDNKPFLAISPENGNVFVVDPEEPRILEFDPEGNYVRGWGKYSSGPDGIGLASGIVVMENGDVWVSDGGNNVLLRFVLP